MRRYIIVLLAIIIALAGLFAYYKYPTASFNKALSNSVLAPNKGITDILIKVDATEMTLKPPRVPTTLVITSGEAKVEQSLISFCALPMLGVETGRALRPRLGVQFLRVERLDLGLSAGISTDSLDLSLDRDLRSHIGLLRNSVVGLGLALDKDGYSRVMLHFSVFL